MPGWWQRKHDMDAPRFARLGERVTLSGELAQEFLPPPDVRLNLDEDDIVVAIQPNVDAAVTRTRHGHFEAHVPGGTGERHHPLDHPGMGRVVDQGRLVRVERQPGGPSDGARTSRSNVVWNSGIAVLDSQDQRPGYADESGDAGLAGPDPQTLLSKGVTEPAGVAVRQPSRVGHRPHEFPPHQIPAHELIEARAASLALTGGPGRRSRGERTWANRDHGRAR